MSKYHCERCNFSTNNRTKFQRHLETKKHKESPFSHQKTTIFDQKEAEKRHPCKYCGKTFKFKQGMYRHVKYYCKKSEDEDVKELVRLMNEQMKEKDRLLEEKEKKVEHYESQQKKQLKLQERNNKMIKKLTNKLQITN